MQTESWSAYGMPQPEADLVVRDVDAAVRTYRAVYGIGPWKFAEIGPEKRR